MVLRAAGALPDYDSSHSARVHGQILPRELIWERVQAATLSRLRTFFGTLDERRVLAHEAREAAGGI
jgi:hypothetical protein